MAEPCGKNSLNLSLPFYLFQLWESQKSGRLRLNPGPYERQFCLVQGEITPVKKYFPEKDFLDWLQETRRIEPPLRFNRQLLGSDRLGSVVAVLIEHGLLPSQEALELTREFLAARLTDYFNLSEVRLSFEEEEFAEEEVVIKGLFTPDLILRGFRRLNRLDHLSRFLPAEKELLVRQVPAYARKLDLRTPELYLWNQLQTPQTYGALLGKSWLGPTETRKTLLALACLKLVDFNLNLATVENNGRNAGPDLEKSLMAFNEKSAFVYRYMAKQLGLVALNLIEKCYRETQDYLDPIFRNLELRPDGSFEPRAMLKLSLNELSLEDKKNLLRGFEEILAAELLLVKKNLGNQHEEIVARYLARSGVTV
ncbi:MAG: hypothetical protein H5U05_02880 [Candidatus Aminicenantes bacterium]|nr:hypothetical protein [Candidatus Aminicenantes bacterium]